jgi:hypothetical protein
VEPVSGVKITYKRLMRSLKRARKEHPDTIIDALHCQYFSADDMVSPICLLGQVMADNGWTLRDIPGENGERISTVNERNLIFTKKAYALAVLVQDEQDSQRPWGEAITNALSTYSIQ